MKIEEFIKSLADTYKDLGFSPPKTFEPETLFKQWQETRECIEGPYIPLVYLFVEESNSETADEQARKFNIRVRSKNFHNKTHLEDK